MSKKVQKAVCKAVTSYFKAEGFKSTGMCFFGKTKTLLEENFTLIPKN